MDLWNRICKFVDHYRWTVVGVILAAGMFGGMVSMTGCASETPSIVTGQPVAREVFAREVVDLDRAYNLERVQIDARVATLNESIEAHNHLVDTGYEDLERQDEFRAKMLETVGSVAAQAGAGTLNPVALIPLGVGLLGGALGIGASADNRRKDRIIKNGKKK